MGRHEPRAAVRVIDLTPELEPKYLACLEDWPGSEVLEAGEHKARWYRRMKDEGLLVKLALDEAGQVGGMIQAVPIERSPALGRGLYFILCVWVLKRSPAGASRQGRGMGTALLEAVESAARARGARGMAAWGLSLPMWMRAAWYKRHGYRPADRQGMVSLVWKPFEAGVEPPRWPPRTGRRPEPTPGKVVITGCLGGWCQAPCLAFERALRAATPYGELVEVRLVDTNDRDELLAWGQSDALFVDGKAVRTGPPPTEARLARLLGRRVAKLERARRPPGQTIF